MAASAKYGTVIMNHIGCNAITATCELAAHAEKIGCHAIAAMPPFFFKPRHAKDIATWLKQVSDAAPRTPLYYYHFNAITGVFVDPLDIIKACEELGVPTFRGFKFTDYNLFTFANCLTYKEGKYDVLYARDEATLGGVATGARGHIGNAFNYAAGLYHRLRAAFAAGDIKAARLEQERANKLVLMMQDAKYGGQALAINVRYQAVNCCVGRSIGGNRCLPRCCLRCRALRSLAVVVPFPFCKPRLPSAFLPCSASCTS